MSEKIANINQIDPCPNHMYSLTMTEHVRRDVEIHFETGDILCLIDIFIYYVGDAPSTQRLFF